MKYAKLLSLSLIALTLLGCNKTPENNQVINPVEAANTSQEENSAPQQAANDGDSSPQRVISKVNPSPQQVAKNKPSSNSFSQTGIIDETSYDTVLKSLNSITKGCQETKKSPEGTTTNYYICKLGGKIVKAGAYSPVAGAGNEYWFVDNRVIAVQQFHTTELFLYDNNGKLKSKFNYPKKATNISDGDRQEAKRLYNGYDYIFEVFKNNSSVKTSSSKYGTLEELNAKIKKRNGRIIGSATCDGDGKENDVRVDYNGDGMPDECVTANLKIHPSIQEETLETVSSTLNYFAKGCQTTSKTQGNYDYYICKKDGEIVKAIKSQKESVSSVYYWFENGKPLAIQRIDDSNQSSISNIFFVYYPNGELSSIFEIYGGEGDNSKRILNFNNGQIQEAKNLINGYQEIYQVFGIN